jgi:hypothetical protein
MTTSRDRLNLGTLEIVKLDDGGAYFTVPTGEHDASLSPDQMRALLKFLWPEREPPHCSTCDCDVEPPHDPIVQCRCGWKGPTSELRRLYNPDGDAQCPKCARPFEQISFTPSAPPPA